MNSKNHAKRIIFSTCLMPVLFLAACSSSGGKSGQAGMPHYIDGAMAYDKGDKDTALHDLKLAVQDNPKLTMAQIILGDIYRSRGDYADALEPSKAAAELDPYNPKNHYNLGLTYQYLRRLHEASDSYTRALSLDPDGVDAMMHLGLVYVDLNQPKEALAQMKHAVALEPKSAIAHCNLGVALESNGEYQPAELEYRHALELDSTLDMAMSDLAGDLILEQNGPEAVRIMLIVLKKSDTVDHHKMYGDALVIAGRDDDASQQFAQVLKADPKNYEAMNQSASILIRKYQAGLTLDENLRQQALALWQKSLAIKPDQRPIKLLVNQWEQGGKVVP